MSSCWVKGMGWGWCDPQVFIWLAVIVIFLGIVFLFLGGKK